MTENTTASGAADLLRAAITRAFNLGQTYCQQADSESYAEQGKPVISYKKYKALLDETCTPLAECAPVAPAQHIVLSDEQIKAHGDRASGMMARDMTRFDAACEVMKYLKEQGAPYYYMYRMGIVLHGNYEGTEAARAPDKAAPVAPAPQPAPMPYPTDAQIEAVYEQTMSQHLRSQDAPAVRRFGRAMFFCAWNSATQAAPAPQPTVPEGYVLVPVEPTEEMEAAAYRNSSTYGSGPGADYRAMIAAAPKADHIPEAGEKVALAAPAVTAQGRYYDAHFATPAAPAPVAEDADQPRGFIKPDTSTHVYFYEQDFYVLSNFSAFTLYWDGVENMRFDTSEAAYHWEKFPGHDDIRAQIINAPSAHEAFKVAERNKAHRRPGWDEVKVDVMRRILRAKADQHEYVRRKLLATGDRILVEDSWRDNVWGWGPNRDGQNLLGKLWMEVRDELRAQAAPPAQEVLLNPDMPTQELRLHMGELTTDEVLVARAAIRWANSQQEARVPLDRIARDLLFDVKNRVNALVLLPSSERRESEIRIKQDIADFLAAPPAPEVRVPLSDAEALAIVRSVPALVTAEEEWLWAIREVEKYHDITAAQKAAP